MADIPYIPDDTGIISENSPVPPGPPPGPIPSVQRNAELNATLDEYLSASIEFYKGVAFYAYSTVYDFANIDAGQHPPPGSTNSDRYVAASLAFYLELVNFSAVNALQYGFYGFAVGFDATTTTVYPITARAYNNILRPLAISSANAVITILNAQPIVQDPAGQGGQVAGFLIETALTTAGSALTIAGGVSETVMLLVNNGIEAANTIANNLKTNTIDPLVAETIADANERIENLSESIPVLRQYINDQIADTRENAMYVADYYYQYALNASGEAGAIIDEQVAAAMAALGTAGATVLNAIAQYQAVVTGLINQAIPTLTGLINQYVTFITDTVGTYAPDVQEQIDAVLEQIAQYQAFIVAIVNQGIAQITTLFATLFAQALATVNSTLAQLVDRPLYYGALSTPVTITSPSDVIVIPVGGLKVTAD